MRRSSSFVRILLWCVLLGRTGAALAQDSLYYAGRAYGSEALFNPASVILNAGFDIWQLEGWSHDLSDYPFRAAAANIFHSLASPVETVKAYGLRQFVTSELLPLSTKAGGGGQWMPNYHLHLVGGGMMYASLREWYAHHGVPAPTAAAVLTAGAYHLVTESVENGAHTGYNGDVVADLYVFDAGGILLFSSPAVRRFFRQRLNLASWSLQPSIGLPEGTIENTGQYFSMRWKVPSSERWHLFYYFGMNHLFGASYRWTDGRAVSAGAGMHARRLVTVDQAIHRKTAELVPTAGVFFDRHNSLLASLVYSAAHETRWSLNVYPGVLRLGAFSPGLWAQVDRNGHVLAGFSTRWSPGLAFRTGQP